MPRTRRTLTIAAAGLVGLGFLLIALENVRGRRAVAACKARLAEQGEKFDIDEHIPPSSIAARTAANNLLHAGWQLTGGTMVPTTMPGAMRMVAPGKAAVAWRQADLREPGQVTNTWETLGIDLARNAHVLHEIRQILKDGAFDAGLDYHQGFNLLLPHLSKVKGIAQWLSAEVIYRLHAEERELALEDLHAMLALVDSSRDERLLICQLVRIAIAAIAFAPTWEALQADGWTDKQLEGLQSRWRSLQFMTPLKQAFQMERAMSLDTFKRLRKSGIERRQLFSGLGWQGGASSGLTPPTSASDIPEFASQLGEKTLNAAGQLGREKAWLWLWSYRDELKYLEVTQVMLEVVRAAEAGRPFADCRNEGTNRLDPIDRNGDGNSVHFLSTSLAPALEKAAAKAARIEVQRDLIVAAIALKRHHLRYGTWPPTLATLVPEFLPAPPRDFMDGEGLRYRPDAGGTFLLYSVNEDGRDDGGDPGPVDAKSSSRFMGTGRDLVWPVPATKEEIAAEKPRLGRR